MNKKTKLILIISACVIIVITVVIISLCIYPSNVFNSFIKENKFYEAYKCMEENNLDGMESSDAPSVQFFDVMAHHYKKDIIGEGKWVLPDFTGWSCAEIAYALNNIGQSYKIEFVENQWYNANAVVEQLPKCGEKVLKTDVVTLKVNNYYSTDNIGSSIVVRYNLITENGEWIYYMENECIYKSRIDGSEKVKIYENSDKDKSIVSVAGKSDNLYCILNQREIPQTSTIISIDLSDLSSKVIAETKYSPCYRITIYGNTLTIYADYEYDLKTEELTEGSGGNFVYYDGAKYYDGYYDFRKEGSNGVTEKLIKLDVEGIITNYCIVDNAVYVIFSDRSRDINTEHLYIYDLNTKQKREVTELVKSTGFLREYEINVWKKNIILTTNDGKSVIYHTDTGKIDNFKTLNKNGVTIEKGDYVVERYSVCGNYIYFYVVPGSSYFSDYYIYPYRYNLMTGEKEEFLAEK